MTTVTTVMAGPVSIPTAPATSTVQGQLPAAPTGLSDETGSSSSVIVDRFCSPGVGAPISFSQGFSGDVVAEVLRAQTEQAKVRGRSQINSARAHAQARSAAFEERLEQLQAAAKKQEEADSWGDFSKVLKWVGAAVAAAAGIAGAVFTGGGSVAVAAVVISVVLAGEQVIKAGTDALVDLNAMSPKAASGLRAGLGCLEDIVSNLAEVGAFGSKGDTVAAALNLAIGAAKAVVSVVFSGGSGASYVAQAVCSLTAETVRVAQGAYEIVVKECHDQGKADPDVLLALDTVALLLDLGAVAAGAADAAGGHKLALELQAIYSIVD